MSHAKQPSKRRRRNKALPALGVAGLSLSLASGASAVPGGPAADMLPPNTGDSHEIALGEEEISDVTLATFYVFDKESAGRPGPNVQLARGCGGCHGCGHGCGGCRGCHGCGHGCGGCRGCHGCGWGGCVGIWWGGGCGCGGGGGYWCWRNGVRVWCSY
jgi:hypothetical protein